MGVLTVQGHDFYLDGEKTVLISGAIHYFRGRWEKDYQIAK